MLPILSSTKMDTNEKSTLIELLKKAKFLGKNSSWLTYSMLSAPCTFSPESFVALEKVYGFKKNWSLIKYNEYKLEKIKRAKQQALFDNANSSKIDDLAKELAMSISD